ncbi:MAG: transcription termination/antitermination protein NusA [Alphaproteobacteria bacterium]|nr:transcription termination/antitermination protein NusA [Alphaproteobacteria bacterium]
MEILHVADTVAREKHIDREVVLVAMEEAIQKAGRTKYGYDQDIRASIDRKNGAISLKRYRMVVETIENEGSELTVAQAKRIKTDAKVGDVLIDDLPPIDFGRIAAQTAKQVIIQKVRDAEREQQYEEFKDRMGEIVSGAVKRVEYGNVTIDLGKGEAVLRRDECIPREHFKPNDRVRCYIYDVRKEARGPQVFLSRTHPGFMAALFKQEVPEIYDGLIEIKAVARDPGSRAKIAVYTRDHSIDPVGACVGMRGSRVQAVVQELQGEKIDIVPWSPDIATFIVNALAPAEVAKVVLDEEEGRIDVVVPDEQLSLAIGRRGQNVRLASILTGLDIDILTEAEESARRAEETRIRTALFTEALDVDDVIAHLLVAEGFKKVEEIAESQIDELISIEGFDQDVAAELQQRAKNWLEAKAREFDEKKKALGIKDDLIGFENLDFDTIIKLAEKGVKSRDDLGDLAADELVEILGAEKMNEQQANRLIMAARAHWFGQEQTGDAEAAA